MLISVSSVVAASWQEKPVASCCDCNPQLERLPVSVDAAGSAKHWSLTTLREKLIKIGAKVVRYAKFQLSEVAAPRGFFVAILERIQRFGVPLLLFRTR